MVRALSFLAVVLVAVTANAQNAQELFNYDFETSFPNDGTGYTYNYAYAGQGTPDCSTNVENNDQTSTTADFESGPQATVSADFSDWVIDPEKCWTYAGYGVGVGHVLGGVDDTGNLNFNRRLTSNDLSEYTLSYDAWVDGVGTDPIVAHLNVSFQGPELDPNTGNPATILSLGYSDAHVSANLVPDAMMLTSQRQSFSWSLADLNLYELTTEDLDGDGLPDYDGSGGAGATGPGSTFAWKAGDWADTTQIQLQVQAQGTELNVGQDDDNRIFFDNVRLVAPFESLESALTCDFDGDGSCDFADIDDLYNNFGAGGVYDLDGSGSADSQDVIEWLASASDEANPFNTDGRTYVMGDVNLDGSVTSADLGLLLNNFGDSTGLSYGDGNLNDDASVDSSDLGLLLNNFNFTSASASAVPEPSGMAISLMALVSLLGLARRRR